MKVFKALLLIASIVLANSANAINFGAANVYSGVIWTFTTFTSGLQGCNELRLDASGDFVNSDSFSLYGALNCPSQGGGYATTGTGYFGTDGSFNMTVTVGTGSQIVCNRISSGTLSGACLIFNSSGSQIGSGFVNLR